MGIVQTVFYLQSLIHIQRCPLHIVLSLSNVGQRSIIFGWCMVNVNGVSSRHPRGISTVQQKAEDEEQSDKLNRKEQTKNS